LFALACALIAASVGTDDILPGAFTAHAVDGLWGVSWGIRIYYRWLARHRTQGDPRRGHRLLVGPLDSRLPRDA
jgi:hypothetical protein